jgi:hypothetical protein
MIAMDIGVLTVTVKVKGLWRLRIACWLAVRALVLVERSVKSLRLQVS